MKSLTLFAVLTFTTTLATGQNLIGYRGREIEKYMKKNCTDMNFNDVRNSRFKYLKYSDNTDSQTLLFFLSPDSVCKSVRLICDLSLKSEKMKEFDSIYKRVGENRWIDTHNSKDFVVEMKEEEWSFIVTYEPEL